uniref:ORF11 n=1 Tax=Malaco herpesvirus 4 TaxID=3031800 RepID=A0AA48P7M7_9VIRU|nr:TPA_asm: ORF11 [Malaco herpesvirus 4]
MTTSPLYTRFINTLRMLFSVVSRNPPPSYSHLYMSMTFAHCKKLNTLLLSGDVSMDTRHVSIGNMLLASHCQKCEVGNCSDTIGTMSPCRVARWTAFSPVCFKTLVRLERVIRYGTSRYNTTTLGGSTTHSGVSSTHLVLNTEVEHLTPLADVNLFPDRDLYRDPCAVVCKVFGFLQ